MNHEDKLKDSLLRLERAARKTVKTRGYSAETRGLKILVDRIKEQLTHADSHPASRFRR
jgi:hypothetical protein